MTNPAHPAVDAVALTPSDSVDLTPLNIRADEDPIHPASWHWVVQNVISAAFYRVPSAFGQTPWTQQRNEALRFARREDANTFALAFLPGEEVMAVMIPGAA